MTYEWRTWEVNDDFAPRWGVLPVDEPNNYTLRRLASIYRDGKGMYRGAVRAGGGCHLKTLRGAQRWIERRLAALPEPPTIRNPVIGKESDRCR